MPTILPALLSVLNQIISLQSMPGRAVLDGGGWEEAADRSSKASLRSLNPGQHPTGGWAYYSQAYNQLRASARKELDNLGDCKPWGKTDNAIKQRLLNTLEARYPILQLCARNYKGRRICEDISRGWNRTARN